MVALRTIVAQGRKRIGFLIGAGAPAGMAKDDGTYPLIPAVAGLTEQMLNLLDKKYEPTITALKADLATHEIEAILSRVRSFSQFLGKQRVHSLDGEGYKALGADPIAAKKFFDLCRTQSNGSGKVPWRQS
jgi:hypothetical protein